jgi:hypothetical protein
MITLRSVYGTCIFGLLFRMTPGGCGTRVRDRSSVSLPVSASTLATPCNIYADSIYQTRGDNEHEL